MEFSSYDQLLRQVDILKVENNNLRRELADNCDHLTQLENEASTMKDVFIHHHLNNGRLDDDERTMTEKGTAEAIPDNRQTKTMQTDDGQDGRRRRESELELSNHNPGSFQAQIQQLERERARILQDIEAEEKEKQLFHACMERINHQLFDQTRANGQADHARKQRLQREADSLRETMQQKLGSRGEMHRREEARVHGICLIEKEIEKLCQLQENSNEYVNNATMDAESLNEKSMTDLCDDDQSKCAKLANAKVSSMMARSTSQAMDAHPMVTASVPGPPDGDVSSLASLYHGVWPLDKVLWHSGPSSVGGHESVHSFHNHDTGSVASGKSNAYSSSNVYSSRSNLHQLGTKVEMVYSLLAMLGSHDKDDVSRKLLSMSVSVDSCIAMRQSGCMPLLVELLHGSDKDSADPENGRRKRPSKETRLRAGEALHNVVHSQPDDKRGRREARVLRLLEQIRDYCNSLSDSESDSSSNSSSSGSDSYSSDDDVDDPDHDQQMKEGNGEVIADVHPVPAMAMLMKLSFDEEHRHAMCQLGGLQATAELLQQDYEKHGNRNDQHCITLRRYAGMALTNLTFGDGTNKALLCSLRSFMKALVAQLNSPSEDLRQVIASVLRNLSWRADQASKKTLREVGAVGTLVRAAMEAKKESTLKSILSALWNLSAHCSMNKADICTVDGALAFLVGTLSYRSPSNTHSIVENGGGILRNISSHVAVREDYRAVLRLHNCLQILLLHLRSPSLTIVSNACGTLWNLSARCVDDQRALWEMGAVGMLKNLVHSKHKMISMGSSAALKNLLAAKPGGLAANAELNAKSKAPSLLVRKQKALEAELDQNLAETCENLDSPKTSPTHHRSETFTKLGSSGSTRHASNRNHSQHGAAGLRPVSSPPFHPPSRMCHSVGSQMPSKDNVWMSESKESILSTQSDSSHDRLRHMEMLLRHRQKPSSCHDTLSGATPQGVLESRIQYVMQEVTRQIAMENELIKSDCHPSSSSFLKTAAKVTNKASSEDLVPKLDSEAKPVLDNDEVTCNDVAADAKPNRSSLQKYSNLTSMIENMKLDDDASSSYQPVDYSLKYPEAVLGTTETCSERVPSKTAVNSLNCVSNQRNDQNLPNADWHDTATKSHPDPVKYGDYAETDLDGPDQPTNFSLRYTEDTDTTDTFRAPDPQEGSPFFGHEYGTKGPSFQDDTIMTYCTEDTPLNFSTATSLSDLRELKDTPASIEEEEEEEVARREHVTGDQSTDNKVTEEEVLAQVDGKVELAGESMENGSPLSKGMTSNKLVSYCVEGTPPAGCLSWTSPLGSIGSNEVVGQSVEETSIDDADQSTTQEPDVIAAGAVVDPATVVISESTRPDAAFVARCNQHLEGKTVTFGEDQHYAAEETPLMFSRCSSLGSLSSFDQHSIHDDHSSVISDFSRRASEVVSPSDLPDSPGQTLPSSPRPRQAPVSFFGKSNREGADHSKLVRPCPAPRSTVVVVAASVAAEASSKKSVFEDAPRVYHDEDTPLELSTVNSVTTTPPSCRSAADREPPELEQTSSELLKPTTNDKTEMEKTFAKKANAEETKLENVQTSSMSSSSLSDDGNDRDNEEDILAACINSAMPNNSRHNKQKLNNSTKLCSKINILSGSGGAMNGTRGLSCIPVRSSSLKLGNVPGGSVPRGSCAMGRSGSKFKSNNDAQKNVIADCGSSDTSSVFDDDPERILAQCIRSGMPKSKNEHAGNLLVDRLDNGSPGSSDKVSYDKAHFSHMYLRTKAAASSISAINREVDASDQQQQDDLTVYAVEGTPINFSSATSLSSLTVDSSSSVENTGKVATNAEHCSNKEVVRHKANYMKNGFHGTAVGPRSQARTRQCNLPAPKLDDDAMIRYAEESTPSCLSRGSSLSALSVTQNNDASDAPDSIVDGGGDHRRPFQVEGTPVCFSQNSSLSSLSVESLLVEPSPSEQALLEECIISGMPKEHSAGTAVTSNEPEPATPGGRLRGSRLPCPSANVKDKCRNIAKMNCIQEKAKEGVPGEPEMPAKNLTGPVVVAEDVTSMAAAAAAATAAATEETTSLDGAMEVSTNNNNCTSSVCENVEFGGALLVMLEATKVSLDVQKVAKAIPESMEQSLVSASSDLLDNVNPPSAMADLSSSGTSDSLAHHGCNTRPRAVKALPQPQRTKNYPEHVIRALTDGKQPASVCESLGNLSIIDNVKPPSVMDDVDLTSSMYSVSSIVSEVADTKSDALPSIEMGSDAIFSCLKPAVAMAEMYARNFTKGDCRSQCYSVSEIQNVNPPSTLLELETLNDLTEAANTNTLENNDTDVEDDLPDDPEPWIEDCDNAEGQLLVAKQDGHRASEAQVRRSTAAMLNVPKESANEDDEELDITPEEQIVLQEDANRVLNTLNEIQFQNCYDDASFEDIECETLSLVSNESGSSYSTSEARDVWPNLPLQQQQQQELPDRGRPRIVKPGDRHADYVHPNEDEAPPASVPKAIRGRRKALYSRPQTSSRITSDQGFAASLSSPLSSRVKDISSVKPTRTSALRATQSQRKGACGPIFASKRIVARSGTFVRSSSTNGVIQHGRAGDVVVQTKEPADEEAESRPGPPVKQATFTKEKPSLGSPPKISPSNTRIPAFHVPSACVDQSPKKCAMDERPPRGAIVRPTSRPQMVRPSRNTEPVSAAARQQGASHKSASGEPTKQPHPSLLCNRRGQSSSPVLRSPSSGTGIPRASIVASVGVRNSPSTHSLGSNGSNGNGGKRSGSCPQNNKVTGLVDGFMTMTKRSSSNGSLCSNSSSSTNTSRFSAKKEVQSKVASLWKSVNKSSSSSASKKAEMKAGRTSKDVSSLPAAAAVVTPKEGLSRSSTYEKLSTTADCVSVNESGSGGAVKPAGFLKKGTRALAEARLQEWLARKARQAAKRNHTAETSDDPSRPPSMVAAAVVAPFNYTPSSCSGLHQQQQQQPHIQVVAASVMVTPSLQPPPLPRSQRSLIPTPSQVSPLVRQKPREAYIRDDDGDNGATIMRGNGRRLSNGNKQPCLVSMV